MYNDFLRFHWFAIEYCIAIVCYEYIELFRYYWSYLVCRLHIMFIVQISNKLFISSF